MAGLRKTDGRGQSTAETLTIITLVVIGAIGLWTALGKELQVKLLFVSAAIVGDQKTYDDAKAATRTWSITATEKAKREGDVKMEGVDARDLKSD